MDLSNFPAFVVRTLVKSLERFTPNFNTKTAISQPLLNSLEALNKAIQ